MIRLLMIVLTVRRVATFLRLPWWISMLIMFLLGCEKLTATWLRLLVSFPVEFPKKRIPRQNPSPTRPCPCSQSIASSSFLRAFRRRRLLLIIGGSGVVVGVEGQIPLGPSTVTSLDLMCTLTVRQGNASVSKTTFPVFHSRKCAARARRLRSPRSWLVGAVDFLA